LKITDGVYQVSGIMYGTNSNTFVIQTKRGLVLIDAGFSSKQYGIMKRCLEYWGMDINEIRDVYITHSHFDHSGNAHLFKKNGANIFIGEDDRNSIESGDESTLEKLFGSKFHVCRADRGLKDGEAINYDDISITVISIPGHTRGSIALLANVLGEKILFCGDQFTIKSATPADELILELGWNGDPNFCKMDYIESFKKLEKIKADIVAPGHSAVYYGDSVKLFQETLRSIY
jgi:glyoxylase-like metal-dependent hydrolase (beta-lactamase superfamily II)